MRGDPTATKTFNDLVALSARGDDVADAVAGIQEPAETVFQTSVAGMSRHDLAGTVIDLRAAGLDDSVIAMALNNDSTVSLAEYRAAEAMQNALKSDPNWRAQFLSGDFQCKKEQLLLSIVLSSTIAEP
jgi:hypothetical protein